MVSAMEANEGPFIHLCQTDVLTHPRIQFLYPHDFESQRLTNDSTICVVALPVSVDWYSSLEVDPCHKRSPWTSFAAVFRQRQTPA